MRKSTKIKVCILSASLVLTAVAAVGCGKGDHTHDYSSEWAFNATAHWHPATCSHDAKTSKAEHSYVATVIPPSVTSAGYTLYACACGYSYTSDTAPSLPVEGELRFDENGHWNPVLQGGQPDVQPHEYAQSAVIEPTCSTHGYTKHSCECGYWYADAIENPLPHVYDETAWGHDENGHWHVALCCGVAGASEAHNFEEHVTPATCDEAGYTQFTCTDCGYSYRGRVTPAGHSYSDTLEGDEYEHWRPATCAHNGEKADVEEHALIGRSNQCAVCGKTVTPRLAYALSASGEYYIVTGMGCLETGAVTIPATYRGKPVQEIADRAFSGEEITSVTFEGTNLKKIGAEAFAGTSISAVSLPGGLEEIGAKAFTNTAITSLTLGESLINIGNAAFRDCTRLKTVTIAGNLSALPPYAFEGCIALTSVTFSGSAKLTEIGAQAFSNCAELVTLDLSECEKVGFAAFGGCEKFKPENLQKLSSAEEYAFSGCAVESVTLPALEHVADRLFEGCEKLTSATLYAIDIGASAFENCTRLTSVTLTGTQLIGANAFKGCSGLTLTLPDTVIRVGAGAFDGMASTTVGGVKYVANVAIGIESGTSVSLQAGTVGIADGAFKSNQTITSVTLSDSVRFIGVDAFRGCEKVTAITFTASVKYIGANSFRESGLQTVNIPDTVLIVGDNAFYDCKSLTSVTVNAQEIGKFAFSYTGVGRTLDSPIKQRPDYAKLTSVTLGSGVKLIGSNAFQYCPITTISLPESLNEIGKYAFAQTDLTSITIPAQVTKIGEYAFYDCKSLTSATFADMQGWKAGKNALNLSSASQNATYLKNTYLDYDWVKE